MSDIETPESPLKLDPASLAELKCEDFDIADIQEQVRALNEFERNNRKRKHEKMKFAELSSSEDEATESTPIKKAKKDKATAPKARKPVTLEQHQKKKKPISSDRKKSVLGTKANKVAFGAKVKAVAATVIKGERDSLEDFEVPKVKAQKMYRPSAVSGLKTLWPTPPSKKAKPASALGRRPPSPKQPPKACLVVDEEDSSELDDESFGKSLSVTIIDKDSRVLKSPSGAMRMIQEVPVFKSITKVFRYVAHRYFLPPLDKIEPYAYHGKIGRGLPYPLPATTTIADLKLLQKGKKVGVDRIAVVGKAPLELAEIAKRYKANQRAKDMAGCTPVHLRSQPENCSPVYIDSSDASSNATEVYDFPSSGDTMVNNLGQTDDAQSPDTNDVTEGDVKPVQKVLNIHAPPLIPTPSQSSVSSQMLDDVMRNTQTISAFVDYRTKAVDDVAKTLEEIKEEVSRSARKVDELSVTTEFTSKVVKEMQFTLTETRGDIVHLKKEVMEVETKTADEIKDELVLRRNKIITVQTKVEGVETSVQEVKMIVEGIRNDVQRRGDDGPFVERSHTMMEGIGHELQLMRKSMQDIAQNKSTSESGLLEAKAEVDLIRKDVDYMKTQMGELTSQIGRMEIAEKGNVPKIDRSTNTSPVAISAVNNQVPATKTATGATTAKRPTRTSVRPKRLSD